MPELPEVETIRRDLSPGIVGRSIIAITGSRNWPNAQLRRARGEKVVDLRRRGKYLLAGLGTHELVIHLGMSGRLLLADGVPPVRHVRTVFELSDGKLLVFVDRRRFGVLQVVHAGDYRAFPTLLAMGPEPLSRDFQLAAFAAALESGTGAIKARLLNQRLIAGLGNIYVDEALHRARIHPTATRVDRRAATRLHHAIRHILQYAISRRGTTFSLFRDGLLREGDFARFLRVFGREGQPCIRCRATIAKTQVGGRGTHFCPRCQAPQRSS